MEQGDPSLGGPLARSNTGTIRMKQRESEDNKAKITDWTGEQTLTGKDKQKHIVTTRQRS